MLVFTNHKSTNSRFFFLCNQDRIFSIEVKKILLNLSTYIHKNNNFAAPLKENKTFFMKKKFEFVDSEFVKISHKQVNYNHF